jgi:protein-disulfide isomerase
MGWAEMKVLEECAGRTSRRKMLAVVALSAFGRMARAQELEGTGNMTAAEFQPPLADMALGPPDARVTVIEYASASCPNCRAFYESHFGALKAAYIRKGKIRFIVREFPHNDAGLAAFMVARCAAPEQYFDYLDAFFTTQDAWTINPHDGLLRIALDHGMTANGYERCIKDADLAAKIHEGRNLARSHGVDGVPALFINNVRYTGEVSYEGLSAEIDRLLAN